MVRIKGLVFLLMYITGFLIIIFSLCM